MRYCLLLLLFTVLCGFSPNDFSRAKYYQVFQEGTLIDMENLASSMEGLLDLDAYQGALLMKISGVQKNANKKLKIFKSGKILLETSIEETPENVEWRFLRLMIQENAPAIVKYRGKLEEDKDMIINNFSTCDKKLQDIIRDYARKSNLLKLEDLAN